MHILIKSQVYCNVFQIFYIAIDFSLHEKTSGPTFIDYSDAPDDFHFMQGVKAVKVKLDEHLLQQKGY